MARAAGLLAVWLVWAALFTALSLGALKEDAECVPLHFAWLAAGVAPLVVGLAVTFAPRGRLAVIRAAFAAASLIGGAIAVTLTLAPDAWPVVAARVLRLCR